MRVAILDHMTSHECPFSQFSPKVVVIFVVYGLVKFSTV